MKIIVKSPCFIKGDLLKPGKDGSPVTVSSHIGNAAITCGRAVLFKGKESKKPAEDPKSPPEDTKS